MGLTVDDLNAVRAQWEEWTADKGFELSIEVRDDQQEPAITAAGALAARLESRLYCQVEVYRDEPWIRGSTRRLCVFSERVPFDAAALRASVTVLARTIAGWGTEGEGGDG